MAEVDAIYRRLSHREKQVGKLLHEEGLSNTEIGKRLGIGKRMVKAHMAQMFLSFGIIDSRKYKRVCLAVLLYRRAQWEQQVSGFRAKPVVEA